MTLVATKSTPLIGLCTNCKNFQVVQRFSASSENEEFQLATCKANSIVFSNADMISDVSVDEYLNQTDANTYISNCDYLEQKIRSKITSVEYDEGGASITVYFDINGINASENLYFMLVGKGADIYNTVVAVDGSFHENISFPYGEDIFS